MGSGVGWVAIAESTLLWRDGKGFLPRLQKNKKKVTEAGIYADADCLHKTYTVLPLQHRFQC